MMFMKRDLFLGDAIPARSLGEPAPQRAVGRPDARLVAQGDRGGAGADPGAHAAGGAASGAI